MCSWTPMFVFWLNCDKEHFWCVTWPGPCHHGAPVGDKKCPPPCSPSLSFTFPRHQLREVWRRSDSVQTEAMWVCVIWNRLGANDPHHFSDSHYAHPLPPIYSSSTVRCFFLTINPSLGSPVGGSSTSVSVFTHSSTLPLSLLIFCTNLN